MISVLFSSVIDFIHERGKRIFPKNHVEQIAARERNFERFFNCHLVQTQLRFVLFQKNDSSYEAKRDEEPVYNQDR